MEIVCPACKKNLVIGNEETEIRNQLVCPCCQQNLEIIWLYPLTIDVIEEFSAKAEYSHER